MTSYSLRSAPPKFPTLIERMRAKAKEAPDHAEQLDKLADDLEGAIRSNPVEIRALVGAWARARRYWCDVTGEDLI